jgi:hypothetical protein
MIILYETSFKKGPNLELSLFSLRFAKQMHLPVQRKQRR